MDYTAILIRSAQIVWQYKRLWLVGLILNIGGIVAILVRLTIGTNLLAGLPQEWLESPELFESQIESQLAQIDPMVWLQSQIPLFLGIIFGSLVAGLVWWVFDLWLRGFVMSTTLQAETAVAKESTTSIENAASGPPSWSRTISQGNRWLGRFIALDAIIFLPLFLLSLIVLLLIIGVSFSAVGFEQGNDSNLATFVFASMGCILLLFCAMFPLSIFSTIFRQLTFLETAVHEQSVRTTIGNTWRRLRNNFGDLLVWIIMLWGLLAANRLIGNTITSLIYSFEWPGLLQFVDGDITFGGVGMGLLLVVLLLELLLWLAQSLVIVFGVVCWTVAYKEVSFGSTSHATS